MPDLELLTEAELKAMDLTAELWNLLVSDVVADGRTQKQDLHELVHHLHAIQHTVLSQAAARAYPERYRPLGGVIEDGGSDG